MPWVFSTEALPPAARLAAWRDACGRAFGALEVEPGGGAGELLGQLDARRAGALGIAEIVGSAQRVVRRPRRDALAGAFNVLLQLEGEARVETPAGAAVLRPMQFVAVDGARAFALEQPARFRQALFSFPRAALPPAMLRGCARASVPGDPADAFVADQLALLLRHAGGLGEAAAARLLEPAVQILGTASAFLPARELPEPVRRALDVIEAHLHDPALDAAAVHARVGRGSRRLLEQQFARAGLSIARELWRRRVERARRLLRDPAHAASSLLDIALACGFSSAAHFSRAFRAATGTAPGAYRRAPAGATQVAR